MSFISASEYTDSNITVTATQLNNKTFIPFITVLNLRLLPQQSWSNIALWMARNGFKSSNDEAWRGTLLGNKPVMCATTTPINKTKN